MRSLRPNAFVCPTARHWVILDVDSDRYLSVGRTEFDELLPWLHGLPNAWRREGATPPTIAPSANALGQALIENNILSSHQEPEHRLGTVLPPPTEEFAPSSARSTARFPLAGLRFFSASAMADSQLRFRSFGSTVRAVAMRRRRYEANRSPSALADIGAAFVAFNAYRLSYPRSYLCLFDSLAFLEFARRYRLFPYWVFGVKADPFEAHCWVQQDQCVINDTLDRVALFTPIAAI